MVAITETTSLFQERSHEAVKSGKAECICFFICLHISLKLTVFGVFTLSRLALYISSDSGHYTIIFFKYSPVTLQFEGFKL